MAVLQTRKLSNRTVAALSVERDTVCWDRELTGFGVRVYPTGGKVFVAQARGPDGPDNPHKGRRITVGRHPVLSAEQACQRAALIIARVKAGEEPVPLPLPAKYPGGPTVADLARRYLEEHVAVRCKPKTQRTARSVVNRHIVSALGKLPIAAVERRHVMALHESLCEIPAMANMAVETLSQMYKLAGGWDMVPEDCVDPCESIPLNPKRKRERFLTDAEFTRLEQVLDEVSGNGSQVSAGAITTIRLLMLTGCRKSEIMTLAVAACRSRPSRGSHRQREDWRPHGPLVAVGGGCVRVPAARAGQSLGRPGRQAGHAHGGHRPSLAVHPGTRRTARRAHPRHTALLCNTAQFV